MRDHDVRVEIEPFTNPVRYCAECRTCDWCGQVNTHLAFATEQALHHNDRSPVLAVAK